MFSEKSVIPNGVRNELGPMIPENHSSIDRLQSLVAQSFDTLESILNNPEVSAQDKATVALKILEMVGTSPQFSKSISLPNSGFQKPSSLSSTLFSESFSSNNLPAKYYQIDNFLSPEENQKLLEIALKHSDDFIGSTTSTQASDYRKSAVLYATFFPEFYQIIRQKLLGILGGILKHLNHPSFSISEVEMQLTAHNDGCYYKIHNDSGSPETCTREFTYVYYFYREPKSFSGGELRIYETDLQETSLERHENFQIVEPRNNSIVFFDSRSKHEVMPVICPSRIFADSRFTINGWLRRGE
ncbi:2OG-Fe(II) oxygenase [Crocosphaera sp. XPORK-15E]|uniref:2OG-Fe(II) oxygenase n=1 Tax=Crocosphaera sp. XPORK-15E TaxID=3110247 RepID=UPI002B1EDDD3|nr:2OG-Fe(II) oxygenase [Crocosphaera sp. XPORK-15E]MEA5535485.1 2OG-Fe(II) oxygenase [Crocosphaera sp. XPORK-15E]